MNGGVRDIFLPVMSRKLSNGGQIIYQASRILQRALIQRSANQTSPMPMAASVLTQQLADARQWDISVEVSVIVSLGLVVANKVLTGCVQCGREARWALVGAER